MASVPLPNPQPEKPTSHPGKISSENKISAPVEGQTSNTPYSQESKCSVRVAFLLTAAGFAGLVCVFIQYCLHEKRECDLHLFLFSFPAFCTPLAWCISGRDGEVGKLIRREVVSSVIGLLIVLMLNSWVRGEVQKLLQTGAFSLMTGALLISTCRVSIEAIHVRWSHFKSQSAVRHDGESAAF